MLVYNDKKIRYGDRVHISIRPEKFTIYTEKPGLSEKFNLVKGKVEEIIYLATIPSTG